jgi:ABC-type transport system substrate-binding protein
VEELAALLLDPQQQLPWVAGPDSGWLDLDDWLYPYFHSAGAQNSFALRNPDLDALIEAQRSEFDAATRHQLGLQIQEQLLLVNAGVNLVSERVVSLQRPYVHAFPLDVMDGYQDRFAECWIDVTDPTFRGR